MQQEEKEGCRPINPEETIAQLGGRGLGSAPAYTGTRRITRTETRLRLYVNGKPGELWYIAITVSFADLYDIELWSKRGDVQTLLGGLEDLFFDQLQHAVEELYDKAIEQYNGGVIPLS